LSEVSSLTAPVISLRCAATLQSRMLWPVWISLPPRWMRSRLIANAGNFSGMAFHICRPPSFFHLKNLSIAGFADENLPSHSQEYFNLQENFKQWAKVL
jgi:hypothetical protein